MIIISHFSRRINKNLSFLLQKNSLFSPEFLKVFFRIRLLPFSPCGAFLMRRPSFYPFSRPPLIRSLSPLFSSSFPFFSFLSQTAFSMRLLSSPFPFTFRLSVSNFSLTFLLSPFSFFSALYISPAFPLSLFFILLISNFLYAAPFKVPYMPPVFPRSPIFAPAVFPPRPPRRVLFPCSLPCGRSSPTRFLKPVLFRYTPAAKIVIAIPKIPRAG